MSGEKRNYSPEEIKNIVMGVGEGPSREADGPFEKTPDRPPTEQEAAELRLALKKAGIKEGDLEALERAEQERLDEKMDRIGEIFADAERLALALARKGAGAIDLHESEKYGTLSDDVLFAKIDQALAMIEDAKKQIGQAAGGRLSEEAETDLADLDVKLHTLRSMRSERIRASGIDAAKRDIDTVVVDPDLFKKDRE